MGSGKVSTPGFLGAPVNFHYISFFYPSTPSMRKGGGMMFVVATSVVAGDRSNADGLERRTLVPIR